MRFNPVRFMWPALVVAAAALLLVALPAVVQRQQTAHAEQIRSRAVRELSAKRSWRAEITETETGSDGSRSVMSQQLLVRKPGQYRLTMRERDSKGREVLSTAIRANNEYRTLRTNADGSTELHIIRGVRPSLGVELDNLLGQTVQAVADAKPLRVAARGSRNGRPADKLELGSGHFVWVDEASGIPVEEQVLSNGRVVHSVEVKEFEGEAPAPDAEFEPSSLGTADVTTVEDLGFRPVDDAANAANTIGFAPLDVPSPAGFSADVQGYVDPGVPNGDAPAEGAFVCAFSDGLNGVIVTQVSRPGAGDSFVPADDGSGAFDRVVVGGAPAALFHDAARDRLVFVRRDVLVTIEGNLTESVMTALAESIR